ncbi:hypothetical protein RUND412_002859 [Rhizina undulata]
MFGQLEEEIGEELMSGYCDSQIGTGMEENYLLKCTMGLGQSGEDGTFIQYISYWDLQEGREEFSPHDSEMDTTSSLNYLEFENGESSGREEEHVPECRIGLGESGEGGLLIQYSSEWDFQERSHSFRYTGLEIVPQKWQQPTD